MEFVKLKIINKEINTLEELLELQKEVGHEIIIGSSYNQNDNSIEDTDWSIK